MSIIVSRFNQTSAVMLEQIGNKVLSLDAEASSKLEEFDEKIVHLHVTDLSLNYYFLFPGGALVVKSQCERLPAASISGTLSAFLAAANAENSGDSIFSGDLHFTGELNTARQFQTLAQSLDIDWQQPLSQIFGDVVGHYVAEGVIKLGSFAKSLLANLQQDIPEYLQEEVRVTPGNIELESFYEEIDLLRSQADRLKARVSRLVHHE